MDIGTLIEQMILKFPDEEIEAKLRGTFLENDSVEKIMNLIHNSRLKHNSKDE